LQLQLITQTDALEEAEDWLRLVPNIEGVVAKRWDGRYVPGQRDWVKVKRRRTIDCVVIGIAGDHTHPWLVLGLRHADGKLHHLGVARPSKGMLSAQLASVLAEAGPEESPIRSRWQHAAVPTWRRVPPTPVCEVAYTVLDLLVNNVALLAGLFDGACVSNTGIGGFPEHLAGIQGKVAERLLLTAWLHSGLKGGESIDPRDVDDERQGYRVLVRRQQVRH
jgi:hypothetical protein